MGRAVGPVVAPANDDVAAGERVAVVAEVPALKFKFEVDALPSLGSDLALGLAVGEAGLDGFDGVAEFFGNESKQEDDAELVDRLVAQATEVEGAAIGRAIVQGRVAKFGGRRRRRGLPVLRVVWRAVFSLCGVSGGRGEFVGRAAFEAQAEEGRPYRFRARGLW